VSCAVASDASAADYLERLKVLRARCGLDNEAAANAASRTADSNALSDVSVNKMHASASHTVDAVSILGDFTF